MKPWFKNVMPHKDIQTGNLDESVFAANLNEVAEGKGREIYCNPEVFFSKTYFTEGIKNIAKRVIKGLNGGEDTENRVISLQTGFGGGKTHTLISLFHLVRFGSDADKIKYVKEIIDFTGKPAYKNVKIAVFTNKTNDPVQGRKVDGLHIRTIWGEIAYQLGGKEGYSLISENDSKITAPKGLFKKIIEKYNPSLILIDELADYCISASGIKVGSSNLADQTISFLQELTEAISETDKCVLIATLPASAQELAASADAARILNALENRISRVGASIKPVNDEEIFEVVRRRLFEDLGDEKEKNEVISEYTDMYHHCFSEIPDYAVKTEYKKILEKSYPFHPELINIFRLRWASNPFFQRTRGVLRILAAIISDLWKRQNSLTGSNYLIHTSDVDFSNIEAIVSQITSLYGTNWASVITADVSGSSSNAFRIDSEVKTLGDYNITQGIASTIMLGTFEVKGQNKGLGIDEIKLFLMKPNSYNHNEINSALDRYENSAHYLYYSTLGVKRYWFQTKPNIIRIIDVTKDSIKKEDIEKEITNRLESKIRGITKFNVLINPGEDIPEQTKPILIVLHPKYLYSNGISKKTEEIIKKLATKKGRSERIYRNTFLFLICNETGYSKLSSDIKDYLSCLKVREEYKNQLEAGDRDEIKKKIDDFNKSVDTSLPKAFSVISKNHSASGIETMEVKLFKDDFAGQVNSNIYDLLKNEEWMIKSVGSKILTDNNLFPDVEKPVKVKDIYEAFIRFDDKPMITGESAIQNSLLRFCRNGEFAVASGDGKTFTNIYYKQDVPFFDVKEESYWLVDKSLYQPAGISETAKEVKPETETLPETVQDTEDNTVKKVFKTITISGNVAVENYNQVFTSFIQPLVNNKVTINFTIKGVSTKTNPITENSSQYKITKESAKQLGLNFEEE